MAEPVDVESAIVKLIGHARRVAETTQGVLKQESQDQQHGVSQQDLRAECDGLLALVEELAGSLESVYDYLDETLDGETRVTLRKAHGTVQVELYMPQNNRRLHGRGRSARSALLDAQPRKRART